MLVAEQFPSFEVSGRRHGRRRSRRSRFLRNLRRNWRRARWRKTIISLVLAVGAVIGGYKASMYVVNQDVPSPEELNVVPRGK
jgi:hypothetical protein